MVEPPFMHPDHLRYDAELDAHLEGAVRRLEETLHRYAPHLAAEVLGWLRELSPAGQITAYFRHEHRFPMLLLPWWLARTLGTEHDRAFHADVVYSTISGYSAIRLLDDTLDAGTHPELLPAIVVLHGEFQGAFTPYFPADHPFWDLFRRQWYGAADFAADHDGARDFERRVERRLGPALIPVAAVAHRAERTDRLEPWSAALAALARVEQLLDDLTDWLPDRDRQAPNLLLSWHRERARPGEPLEAWMLREGIGRAHDQAESWLGELTLAEGPLGAPELAAFLESRRALVRALREETDPGLRELARLRTAFDPSA